MQQDKQKLDQRQYWVNALKYAVYKGESIATATIQLELFKYWICLSVGLSSRLPMKDPSLTLILL